MLGRILHFVISLPMTCWVNFRCLPFSQAVHFPLIVDFRTKISGLYKGCIVLQSEAKFGIIKIGWGMGSEGNPCNNTNYIIFRGRGKFYFYGIAHFSKGVTLRSDDGGIIRFGTNFRANQNFACFCNTLIPQHFDLTLFISS